MTKHIYLFQDEYGEIEVVCTHKKKGAKMATNIFNKRLNKGVVESGQEQFYTADEVAAEYCRRIRVIE